MVGVPMHEPASFSCPDPKLFDAQIRKFEAIKHTWEQSQLRASVPEAMREGMDRCGAAERRQVLRELRRASEAFGFERASAACAEVFSGGRVPERASVDLLCRAAAGAAPGGGADLSVYDGLMGGGGRLG